MSSATRSRWRLGWLFLPVALLVSAGIVGQASYAAFSADTSNVGNSLGVGTVALSDNDAGTALFALTNLRPGSSGSRCIVVTSTGTLPAGVKLYASNPATTRALSTYVDWTVNQGSGTTAFGSCTGFAPLTSGSSVFTGTLASFTGTAANYATGLGSWTPTGNGNESRTFQFTYTISSTIPDTAQGGTASFGLVWESQNT